MGAMSAPMNLYHCMITLKSDAKALAFASAVDHWLGGLAEQGLIGGWTLYRRKLGLASSDHSDVLLMIEVEDMAQLENAFQKLSEGATDIDQRHYELVHDMIAEVQVGLYRPYPDSGQRENVALI